MLWRLLIICSLLSGCVHVVKPTSKPAPDINEVRLKNYRIGRQTVAYVGEPLVRVKEYSTYEQESSLKPTHDFNISGGLADVAVNVNGYKMKSYDIVGEIDISGVKAKAIQIPGSNLFFGIMPDGSFSGVAASSNVWTSPIKGINVYKITPEDCKFISGKNAYALEGYPYENIEILFSGISEGCIHLLYREYSLKDLIRPAFSQELRYPSNSKIIRYKNYKITIREVTPEKIVFTVVSDTK